MLKMEYRHSLGGSTMAQLQKPTFFVASNQEHTAIQTLAAALHEQHQLKLIDARGNELAVPEVIMQLLRDAVAAIAQREGIVLLPAAAEFTPADAAELIHLPLEYMQTLLAAGTIPTTTEGRIRLEDLVAYEQQRRSAQREAIREIAQSSQESGSYD
jgi:hypothetical protein